MRAAITSKSKRSNKQAGTTFLIILARYLGLFLSTLGLFLYSPQCSALSIPLGAERVIRANFRSLDLGRVVPNEVIFRVKPGVNQAEVSRFLASQGIRGVEGNIRTGVQRAVLPLNNAPEVAALLNMNPAIEYAEPNYLARAESVPNDPYYIYQWNFPMIGLESAWDISIGANITVAVIDTGVAFENNGVYAKAPDLEGTIFVPGWDFVNNDAYPDDDNGHGTHITGTIAQATNNLLGVAGIAYGCSVMPVKVLDSDSNGLFSDIADGIYYAVNNGAQIINMSFGAYTPSTTLEDAVNYAYLNGVSIIASAGNNASSIAHYPSSYDACLSVSAVRYDQTVPFYSNYGADIDICAPGGDLSVDQNLDGQPDGICQQTHDGINYATFNYALYQGTSCSAAHVSGVAALVQAVAGGLLSPDELKTVLETTAVDLGPAGWDQDFGWGLVNALNAVQAALPAPATAAGLLTPWWSPTNPINPVNPILTPILNSTLLTLGLPPGLNPALWQPTILPALAQGVTQPAFSTGLALAESTPFSAGATNIFSLDREAKEVNFSELSTLLLNPLMPFTWLQNYLLNENYLQQPSFLMSMNPLYAWIHY